MNSGVAASVSHTEHLPHQHGIRWAAATEHDYEERISPLLYPTKWYESQSTPASHRNEKEIGSARTVGPQFAIQVIHSTEATSVLTHSREKSYFSDEKS